MWVRGLSECAVTKSIPGWLYEPSAPDRTGPPAAWAGERPVNREAESAVAVAAAMKVLRLKTVPPRESVDCRESATFGWRAWVGQVIENCSGGLSAADAGVCCRRPARSTGARPKCLGRAPEHVARLGGGGLRSHTWPATGGSPLWRGRARSGRCRTARRAGARSGDGPG